MALMKELLATNSFILLAIIYTPLHPIFIFHSNDV
jgi:hypothetical protein